MLLERLPEVQSLAPEDKWRLIDEFGPTWRGRLKVQGQRTISSSFSRNVFRIICSTLLKGKGRTKSSHDWRNINASGNNLSSRSVGRYVCGRRCATRRLCQDSATALRRKFVRCCSESLSFPNRRLSTPENSGDCWCRGLSTEFFTAFRAPVS